MGVGFVVGGVLSRILMYVLRLTTGERAIGIVTDDGFPIGEVTLAGTYNLVTFTAAIGVIAVVVFQWVRPWLLGPRWLRIVTVSAGTAAVVGSLLVNASGVDYVILDPTWLAIATFVALPAIYGVVLYLTVEAVERSNARGFDGRRWWAAPLVPVVLAPKAALFVLGAAVLYLVWLRLTEAKDLGRLAGHPVAGVLVRLAWLGIAVMGLVTLINDINGIYDRV